MHYYSGVLLDLYTCWVRHFYCIFFFKSVNDLIHSLCIISVHRSLVIFGLTRKCYIDTFLDWFPRIRGIISVSNWQYITPDQQIWTDCCIPTLIGKKHTAILLLCYVIIFFQDSGPARCYFNLAESFFVYMNTFSPIRLSRILI